MKAKKIKLSLRKATISQNLNSITGGEGSLYCPTLPHMTCPINTKLTDCKQVTCIEG